MSTTVTGVGGVANRDDLKAARGFATGMAVYETYAADVITVEQPFGHALARLAADRPDVLALTADVGKYTDIDPFVKAFPDRFIQIGMAEQNLIGVASGLARSGFIPFATTYCAFGPRRAYDFIAIAMSESHANVKLVCALPGLTTGYGATHQGLEDVALMRAVPGLMVVDPCDATEIAQMVPAIAVHDGPVYARILRGRVKQVFDPATHRFELGKANLVRAGRDLALVSSGLMTDRALQAAAALAGEGIDTAVLHMPTLKPFDADAVCELIGRTGAVVTMENHTLVGGLASSVCEALALGGVGAVIERIGVPDRFMECGSVPYLTDKYGLSLRHVIAAGTRAMDRKTRARDGSGPR